MVYIPGIQQKAADAISRHPTGPKTPEMLILPDDIATTSDSPTPPPPDPYRCSFLDHVHCEEPPLTSCSLAIDDQLASSASSGLRTIAVTWDRVKVATASDRDMVHLMSIIESGFPNFRNELPPTLREYYQFHDHLYTVDSVIHYKDRIVTPPSLRQHVLSVLHSAHQGVTSMIARAPPLLQPHEQTATTATTWHLANPVRHPLLLCHQHTPTSAYVLISSTTRALPRRS